LSEQGTEQKPPAVPGRTGEFLPGWKLEALAAIVLVGAVAWHLAPMYTPPFATGAEIGSDNYRSHDWLEVAKLDFYARKSLLEWGRLPLWNPLLAGGQPQFSHPSDGSMGPLILAPLIFGHVLGMKVNIGLVALFGTLGLFFLLRRCLGIGIAAACAASLGYAWSGWLPARVAVGFYESALVVAWPGLLCLWLMPGEQRARRRRWTIGALVLWALAVQLQLALPVLVMLMALLWGATALQARLSGEPIDRQTALGGLVMLAVAGLLGAVKFLPMLHLLEATDFRQTAVYPLHPDAWYFSMQQFWYALFHHVPSLRVVDGDGNPRVQEYMTLMPGIGLLALAAIGAYASFRRSSRTWPWLVVAAVFTWLSFGPWAPIDGFRILRNLPLFSSMRGPLRYFNFPLLLGMCVVAASGFELLQAHLQGLLGTRRARFQPAVSLILLVLTALTCLPAAVQVRSLYRTSFIYPAEKLPPPEALESEGLRPEFSGDHLLNLRVYSNVLRDVPTIYSPEDIPIKISAQPARWLGARGDVEEESDYHGEAWVRAAGEGAAGPSLTDSATVIAYRGQVIEVGHSLSQPGVVVVNQNHWPGWSCGDRPLHEQTIEELGVLAFEAPPGDGKTTTCSWKPPRFTLGLVGSGLGLIALLGLWPWRRRERGERATDT
jgi:hypothetical protein